MIMNNVEKEVPMNAIIAASTRLKLAAGFEAALAHINVTHD